MGQYPSGFFHFLPMKRYFTLALVASLFLCGVEARERTMDEKQAIASSVLTMQSQTRGKAELTLRLLQALLSMLLPTVLWHGIFVLHLNP